MKKIQELHANQQLGAMIAVTKASTTEAKLAKVYAEQREVFDIVPRQLYFPRTKYVFYFEF